MRQLVDVYDVAWDAAWQITVENLCYVAAVNRIGTDGKGFAYTGDSQVLLVTDIAGAGRVPEMHQADRPGADATLLLVVNAHHDIVNFRLPQVPAGLSSLLGALFFLGYFFFQVPGAIYAQKRSVKKLPT